MVNCIYEVSRECHNLDKGPIVNNRSCTTIFYIFSVASVGMFVTVAAIIVFSLHWNTPVVKASGRELSCILLIGIFMSFLTTFVIVAKPTTPTCGLMRFAIGKF